jgi:DNA-binding FadR family transcriptional regulator
MKKKSVSDAAIELAANGQSATFGSVKRAEAIAAQIEAIIMERGWPIGEVLGSEPDLIEQLGVSRAVFREAIRIVEHHGAAHMRRGPNGGLVISAPDLRAVQRPMTLFLDYADVPTTDLYTVRSTIELTCVGLVAEKMDEERAELLRRAIRHEAVSGAKGIQQGTPHDFHVLLAELSGNVALKLFVTTLANLTFERTHSLAYNEGETSDSHRAHAAIVDALIAGDSSLAQHRMRTHLGAALAYYQQRRATRKPVRP